MQKDNAFFEDLSKFASSATGAFVDMKRELETALRSHMEGWLSDMNLVTREEFDVVKQMAEKAREENELLKERIEALESTQ